MSRALEHYVLARPFSALWLGLAAMVMHALLAWFDSRWLWLPDLLLALVTFYLAFVWQFWRSLKIRLLAMLHLAFLWLGIGAALSAAQLAAFVDAACFSARRRCMLSSLDIAQAWSSPWHRA